MKLVQKMRLFFYPAVLVPFFLIVFLSVLIFRGYLSMVYNSNHLKNEMFDFLNPLSLQSKLVYTVYEEISDTVKTDPDKLTQETYLKKVNAKLDQTDSFLATWIGGRIAFSGGKMERQILESILPHNQRESHSIRSGTYISEPVDYLIHQIDFRTSEGKDGSIYILSDLDTAMQMYRNIFIYILVVGILILIASNVAISWFIKKEFLEPLLVLGEGIEQIKKGNLMKDVPIVRDDEIGEVARSFNEMRDKVKLAIDDRLRYEEENRILISNISHDLKTPITAIKGYVEGIMDGVATTPEMIDRYVKTIYTKAEALDGMINELSIYAKIDSDTIPYNFKKLNLDSFFRDCIDDLSIDLESKNMEITYFNYCPKEWSVVADAEQMKRVITNIIMNAVKYNDKEKGRINIRIREDHNAVQVEVEDNGMGIDEKDLPHIFERLYRADASRNSRSGGTGLGLSISKKIIEEHGGKIWAKSRRNTGTIIIFTLELAREDYDG